MNDRIHLAQRIALHTREQLLRRNNVLVMKAKQVLPFFIGTELVDEQQLPVAARIEFGDGVAADETGSAGDDD